jgi:MATE family multidrug resistance protein
MPHHHETGSKERSAPSSRRGTFSSNANTTLDALQPSSFAGVGINTDFSQPNRAIITSHTRHSDSAFTNDQLADDFSASLLAGAHVVDVHGPAKSRRSSESRGLTGGVTAVLDSDGTSTVFSTDDPSSEPDADDLMEQDPPLRALWFLDPALRVQVYRCLALALPLVFGSVAQNAVSVINLIFVGHEGESELAASSLAMVFCNVTGISLLYGMLSTMDTLASQAYGAGNYRRVGIILQRSLVIVTLQMIATAVIWLFSGPILSALGIEPDVAPLAARFIVLMVAALPGQGYSNALQRYLQCQGNTGPVMASTLISVATVPPLNHLFVNVLGCGFIGAAYTTVISTYVGLLALLGYLWWSGFHKKTWFGWSREALREWGEYLRYGLPGVGMMCAEWWGFEIHTIFAARLGTSALAAQSVLVTLTSLLFMVPMGVGTAAAAIAGAAFGANKPLRARKATIAACGVSLVGQALIAVTIALARHHLGRIFTDEPDVLRILAHVLPLLSFFVIFDGFQGTVSGVLRGAGKQHIGFYINVGSYWLFALPLAYVFAFYVGDWDRPMKDSPDVTESVNGLGIFGQWLVLSIAAVLVACIMTFFMLRLKWEKTAALVHAREQESKVQLAREIAANAARAQMEAEEDEEVARLQALEPVGMPVRRPSAPPARTA